MGWRYRKRFSLGKALRINFSKSGISLGLGPPGANINCGRRGTRTSLGLPGTGLSYQKATSWGARSRARRTETPAASLGDRPPRSRLGTVLLVVIVAVTVFGVLWLVNAP